MPSRAPWPATVASARCAAGDSHHFPLDPFSMRNLNRNVIHYDFGKHDLCQIAIKQRKYMSCRTTAASDWWKAQHESHAVNLVSVTFVLHCRHRLVTQYSTRFFRLPASMLAISSGSAAIVHCTAFESGIECSHAVAILCNARESSLSCKHVVLSML